MVSILDTRGSAPREAGARMVVLGDGSYSGTIGGGALEWKAIADAQQGIAAAAATGAVPPLRQSQQALGPDLGQCCGGSVRLLLEVFDPARLAELRPLLAAEQLGAFTALGRMDGYAVSRDVVLLEQAIRPGILLEQFGEPRQTLALFGAGHVGRAMVLALAPLNFKVIWVDPRPGAFPDVAAGNVKVRPSVNPMAELSSLPDESMILVMTHSHALDFDLVSGALGMDRFAYVGLIGSDTKRARFRSRLAQAGVVERQIEAMVCPIGIPGIRSKQPNAIAASVVADLLCRMEQCPEQWSAQRDSGIDGMNSVGRAISGGWQV